VISVRPKVAELVFQLYGRSLHPELFEVHNARVVERGGYRAIVQITTAGHVISWQYQGITGGLFIGRVIAERRVS
jgi:hypothetical protein